MRESDLQAKIITDLELDGWLVIKMMKLNKAGWPDLLAGRNKITIFIETKSAGKESNKLQQYRHRLLREQGFLVFVIDSWEDYILVKHYNLKRCAQ
jgi:hypothetical protein